MTNTPKEKTDAFKNHIYMTVVLPYSQELFGRRYQPKLFSDKQSAGDWRASFVSSETSSRDRQVLGVDSSATIIEIKAHFRKLAKKIHPDVGGDPIKFREIKQAYDNLLKGSK